MLLVILLLVVWWGFGVFAFIFWRSKQCHCKLDKETVSVAFLAGIMGVFSWFVGHDIYGAKFNYNFWGVKVK